jgi:hypothetical protein
LEWHAYVSRAFRLGIEVGGSFSFGVNARALVMLPITVKAGYLLSASRFEFPLFLALGGNIIRYREWSHIDFIAKAGLGGYWRYDANWSFGLNLVWWLDFQATTENQPPEQARMGNFLEISPSLFYHF